MADGIGLMDRHPSSITHQQSAISNQPLAISQSQIDMTHVIVRVARNAGIVALFIVAAMLGILSGVLFAYAGDLPQVSALDNYSPSTITRIYSVGGQLIGEFATQRRVVVGYDDINPLLRQAIIATEDAEFDRHFGVN